MTSSLYLPKNRRSFDDKLQRSIAECCTQADRWLRIFNEEKNVSLSFKKATLSLGKKRSKTGRRPRAPGRKIDRPPARPGMYFKTTPTRPARAEKRNGRPPTHWACVTNRPGGRPPGPVGGPAHSGLAHAQARFFLFLLLQELHDPLLPSLPAHARSVSVNDVGVSDGEGSDALVDEAGVAESRS